MTSPSAPKETPTAVPPVPASPASPPPVVRESSQGGPGRAIRAAREKLGLPLESLASQTRLARGTLEALERDDFGILNEPVYVKGYYRKCAKVLGLSDVELIAAYERQVGPKQPQAPTKLLLAADRGLGKAGRSTGLGGGLRWLWIVVIAAVVGGGAYLLSTNPGALGFGKSSSFEATSAATGSATDLPTVPPAPTRVPAAPLPQPTPSSEPTTSSPPATAVGPPAHTSVAESSTPPPSAPAASTAMATQPSAIAAGGEGSLSLNFRGTSWVRIEDASGKMLLSGVIQAGDHQMVQGKPPYSVFLGNAPGVTVEYSGRPYDLTPFIKQNSTARFSVPQ